MNMGASIEYIVLPLVALISTLFALLLVIRQKRSKYGSVRLSFAAMFALYADIILYRIRGELIQAEDPAAYTLWRLGLISALFWAAFASGIAVQFYRSLTGSLPKRTVAALKYPPELAFIIGLFVTMVVTAALTPFRAEGSLFYPDPWFAALLFLMVVWFIAYVPGLLWVCSKRVGGQAGRETRLLSVSLALMAVGYGMIVLISPYLRGFFNLEFLLLVVPLGIMAYVFMAPTVLERLIPATETPLPGRPKYKLGAGRSFIVKGDPARAYEIFLDQARHGVRGLCVSKLEPDKVRERYGLEKTVIIWVTFREARTAVSPRDLERAKSIASRVAKLVGEGVILMDCFDVLKTANGFKLAMRFLMEINEMVAASKWSMLVSIDPLAFTDEQLAGLGRELEEVGP